MAFFGSYVFHILMIYIVAHRLTGFTWSVENKATARRYVAMMAAVFWGCQVLPHPWALGLGSLSTVLMCVHSARVLLTLVPMGGMPKPVQNLLTRHGLCLKS